MLGDCFQQLIWESVKLGLQSGFLGKVDRDYSGVATGGYGEIPGFHCGLGSLATVWLILGGSGSVTYSVLGSIVARIGLTGILVRVLRRKNLGWSTILRSRG